MANASRKMERAARQPKALRHWTPQIKSMFPNLSKPQAETLAAFSFGIAMAKSCALNAVARNLAFLGIPDAVDPRLRGFIPNPRINMADAESQREGMPVCCDSAGGGKADGVNVFMLGLLPFHNLPRHRRKIPPALPYREHASEKMIFRLALRAASCQNHAVNPSRYIPHIIAAAFCALLAACSSAPGDFADDAAIGESPALGVHTRQADIDGGKLSLESIAARGERVFTASFNTLDGAGRPETTDTSADNFRARRVFPDNFNRVSGPDANSCASCHTLPRIGGGGDNAANVFVLADRLEFVNFDGGAGDGGERHTLKTVGNERTSTSLFGAGYVELLAREMTADLHAIRDSALRDAKERGASASADLISKGVRFGRLSANPDGTLDTSGVEGVDADLVIRPFMQKGTITSLREFAVKAMNQHFGMQASEQFGDAEDRDADGVADELTRGDLTALSLFQATLPAPREIAPERAANRQAAERGRAIFSATGCAACHIPELPLYSAEYSEPNPFNPAGKLQAFEVENPYAVDLTALDGAPDFRRRDSDGAIMIPVFTDFKRHKMGEILNNEVLEEEGVPTDEWLTRKLWGFASEPPFLHHGRATLISEAILAHGGEAQASRDAFAALAQDDGDALIEFLKTLRIPEESAPEPAPFGLPAPWSAAIPLAFGFALGSIGTLAIILMAARRRGSEVDWDSDV